MSSFELVVEQSNIQCDIDTSYIGGYPSLPIDTEFPICRLCGSEQTFYFQVAFPISSVWEGNSLAVFACTCCEHEDNLIPHLSGYGCKGARISQAEIEIYQLNFRFLVFKTDQAVIRRDYREAIVFRKWQLVQRQNNYISFCKIDGDPTWLLEDEAPDRILPSSPLFFVLQIPPEERYNIIYGAPKQIVVDYYGKPGAHKHADRDYYELFLGNAIYFFGTVPPCPSLIYALVQSE